MKYPNTYIEARFREMVDKALARVKTILDTTRHPRLAHESSEEADHTYDDKYALAEFLTNTGIAAKMNALERLGLDAEKLQQVVLWVHQDKQAVTLRLEASDSCQFFQENVVDMQTGPAVTREVESGSFLGMSSTKTTETVKVTTQVKEYHWKVGVQYRLVIFKGSDPSATGACLELQSRTASTVVVTSGGQQTPRVGGRPVPPLDEKTVHPPVDVSLTWFFQRISPKQLECQFAIDRESSKTLPTCKTPRRNEDIDGAVEFDKALSDWTHRVRSFFVDRIEHQIMDKHNPVFITVKPANDGLEVGAIAAIVGLNKEPSFNGKRVRIAEHLPEQHRYRVDPVDPGLPSSLLIKPQNLQLVTRAPAQVKVASLDTISDDQIFGPVLPLMEKGSILSMGDVAEFLSEQTRSMDEAVGNLSKVYPPRTLMKLVSVAEATMVLVCQHLQLLARQCTEGVDYIEDMLKQQLLQAVGKEVTSRDFDQFMRFHHAKFFADGYAPQPFTYAIRRPNHFPDGTLSIESAITAEKREPIETWTRHVPARATADGAPHSMFLPINAATSVELNCDRFLHGWMQHRFKTRRPAIELVARARQFCSFLIIIGTLMGPNKFDPKDAIILQNKDEVLIPLLTNTLPSAKEFKDAIVSLSPEQQAFAKAFRAMQLESSVFGVCVIQIKPQLERLLRLPDGALTKEIQLTQELMSLFIDYQIPSDLLTFDGDESATLAEKVTAVKGYVKAVMDVIQGEKKKQLEEETLKADMRAEMNFSGPQPPGYPPNYYSSGAMSPIHYSSGAMSVPGAMMADLSESSYGEIGARRLSAARPSAHVQFGVPPPMAMAASAARTAEVRLTEPPKKQLKGSGDQQRPSKPSMILRPEYVQPQSPKKQGASETGGDAVSTAGGEDFTTIPAVLDSKLEKHDTDNALRTTIIKASQDWTRKRQLNLLTPASSSKLSAADIETEKTKAFDLLDAISRSGTLPIDCAEIHVVIGVSHCFENDVIGTIIQDNINPIAKVEKSSLMVASTIYGRPPASLIAHEADVERLAGSFPELIEPPQNDGDVET